MPAVRACCSASPAKPGAKTQTNRGAARMPTTVTTARTRPRTAAVWSTKALTSQGARRARYSDNTGTKAWENPPSANRRRKKLGMRKATMKASMPAPGPNATPSTTSRISPKTRDRPVIRPTATVDLNSFCGPGFSLLEGGAEGVAFMARKNNTARVDKMAAHRHSAVFSTQHCGVLPWLTSHRRKNGPGRRIKAACATTRIAPCCAHPSEKHWTASRKGTRPRPKPPTGPPFPSSTRWPTRV